MIKPTVGRVVLYNPLEGERNDIRHAAIVVMVHSDECVNLVVFDENGVPYHRQSVVLVQDPIVNPKFGQCEWMAYQHGQAGKNILEERIERIERLLTEEAGFELANLVPEVPETTALSGLKAHSLDVELETISFMDEEGEPSAEGEKIHEAEYTFADGVSFVVNADEHVQLIESGLAVADKAEKA